MRTIYPLIVVVALAMAVMAVSLSGFGGVTGVSTDGLQSDGALNESVSNQGVEEGISGGVSNGESGLVGLTLSAGAAVQQIGSMVVLLPVELRNLGFPRAFAYPVGVAAQLLAGIGLFQFTVGRRWD